MKLPGKTLKWLLRIVAGAALLVVIFLSVVYMVLQHDPNGTANAYLEEVSKATGLKFSFGSIEVSLMPLPAISISDLRIEGDDLHFSAAWITARPNFLPLFRGRITPGKITILRPRLLVVTDLPLGDPKELFENLSAKKSPASGDGSLQEKLGALFGDSCEIVITQMDGMVKGANNTALSLHSLQCALGIDSDLSLDGEIRLAALRMGQDKTINFNLENFALAGVAKPLSFFQDTPELKASGQVRYKNFISTGSFYLDFESSTLNWNSAFDLRADLEMAGDIVPASISGRAMELERGRKIVFRGVRWEFGNDNGGLDATLVLPQKKADFQLVGTFMANRLSLTEWLGFTRNLPPGLQISMDNIFAARIDFKMNSKGLQVPKASAVCVGAQFTGQGSVADFAKPVVFLDMRAKNVDLGLSIPEAVGITPTTPHFVHPPLTPVGSTPKKKGETGIGYDIRLGADVVKYGSLKINNGTLRIHPGKMDKIGLEDVLLTGKGNFYSGTMSGECILGVDKSTPYAISGTAKNINAAQLAKDMPSLPLSAGSLRLAANVTSKSKKLDQFLESLRGSVELGADKAVLKQGKQEFNSISAKIDIKGASLEKNRLGVSGQWKGAAKNKIFEGDITLDGKLWFGGNNTELEIASLPASINFTLVEALGNVPAGSKGKLKGNLSGKSGSGKFAIKEGSYNFLGLQGKINGEVDANKSPLEMKGDFSAATSDLDKTVAIFTGKSGDVPQSLRKFSASAAFSGNPDAVRLSGIKATLGKNAINGKLAFEKKGGKPNLDFALEMDALDVGEFTGSDKNQSTRKNWDFPIMRAFNAKGELKAKTAKGWKISIQTLRLPLTLDSGQLSLGPASGRIYGAPLHFRATLDFRKGFAFNGTMSAHGFDLGAAAKAQEIKSVLTGRANLDASLRAKLSGQEKITHVLNGEWSFNIRNGTWQGRSKSGSLEGKPTNFSVASASGTVVNGIFKSGNINLQSSGMTVTGKGSLNLPGDKIDCDFNVNMKGLPDIPLRLYGSLNAPKTSIGAGQLVVNTISGITRGVVDVFGGIVEGVWKILR